MTEILELYKCGICGNVVEVEHAGEGVLVCCGEDMKHLEEFEAAIENPHFAHVEEIGEFEGGKIYKIHFNHVMTHEHHLEFIEVISNDKKFIKRKFLQETESPEMIFKCNCTEGFFVRLYCNRDGVWITK